MARRRPSRSAPRTSCWARSAPAWRSGALPRLQEVGITQLTELGVSDPVYFVGWDVLADLRREIGLLQEHLPEIDFDPDVKAWILAHLVYCYSLLVFTAPPDSTPVLTIG